MSMSAGLKRTLCILEIIPCHYHIFPEDPEYHRHTAGHDGAEHDRLPFKDLQGSRQKKVILLICHFSNLPDTIIQRGHFAFTYVLGKTCVTFRYNANNAAGVI